MDSINGGDHRYHHHQNVVVMRHGDRIDNFDPLLASKADKPWDPPLVDEGKVWAFCTDRNLKSRLHFPIHRVFVSPFLRCLQTASQVISALCAVDDNISHMISDSVAIDPSKIKVSDRLRLSEMMNTRAIRHDFAPKDGDFRFDLKELEDMLPAGTVDHTVNSVYDKLPKWEETVAETRDRYEQVFKALADKYPSENLLFVTHGEGVGVSISSFLEDTTVFEVDYCAYSELRRQVFQNGHSFTTGDFEVLTKTALTGIGYSSSLS